MKHTQRPWSVQKEYVNDFFGDIRVIDSNYDTVCTMPDNWSIWNGDKNKEAAKEARADGEANAKLIAAAPDLLEALNKITNVCDPENREDYNPWSILLAISTMAREAIAKATGEKETV